jgi:hypothetical protein
MGPHSQKHVYIYNFDKILLGLQFWRFIQKTSGHPGSGWHARNATCRHSPMYLVSQRSMLWRIKEKPIIRLIYLKADGSSHFNKKFLSHFQLILSGVWDLVKLRCT